MEIESVETACLGNRSYVAVDGSTAVVVDPPRDIDRIESVLARHGATPGLVIETHRHADYVSGGLELARRHRAAYVVPPGDPEPRFSFEPAVDGQVYGAGGIGVRILATPGHTRHHVSVVLEHGARPVAVCTGGSLLHGSVGRTDLSGDERTVALAHEQWRSARRLVDELPADTRLLPTHGFGSLCSAGPASDTVSATLNEERLVNPALQMAERVYVEALVAGYGPVPRHYGRMPLLNAAGPAPIDLSPAPMLSPADLMRRQGDGHWLVDVRDRLSFAQSHVRGSVNVEETGPLVAYLPWILPPGAGVVLLGEAPQVRSAARQLAQVGIDRPLGVAIGTPQVWVGGDTSRLGSYGVSTFAGFLAAAERGTALALDVRSAPEWAAGHVVDAFHLSLPDLAQVVDPSRVTSPPTRLSGSTWVYCGGGFRAAVASSLLDAAGATVTLINQPFDAAVAAGLVLRESAQAPARTPTPAQRR
jgi:glyoxylase-like metal-dependent hydrolase (beta-lactamase superfamily II)/rhodanese-related sulfurtransferase